MCKKKLQFGLYNLGILRAFSGDQKLHCLQNLWESWIWDLGFCKECIQNAFFLNSKGVGFKIQDSKIGLGGVAYIYIYIYTITSIDYQDHATHSSPATNLWTGQSPYIMFCLCVAFMFLPDGKNMEIS